MFIFRYPFLTPRMTYTPIGFLFASATGGSGAHRGALISALKARYTYGQHTQMVCNTFAQRTGLDTNLILCNLSTVESERLCERIGILFAR